MSSEYRVLCLGHDPAIVVAEGWRDVMEALDAARRPTTSDQTLWHRRCDLMVGRYSAAAALAELACLGAVFGEHQPPHREPEWADAQWLRLLFHAGRSSGAVAEAAAEVAGQFGCWSARRLARLRVELGVADPDELKPEVWRSTREWLADWPQVVIDPDGWRGEGAPDLDEPISRSEFERRMSVSTVADRETPMGAERGNLFLQQRPDALP